MSSIEAPIPLSEIESVLGWVDSFKLSRPYKKINRDFSDAVLLAEILSVHYPKLVEMHNYPPRNSHALKLNNWMTLNRKVLKKLKLNLCCNTMEQLANCAPGVIERVLVMVRDKIRRDEEANKSLRESEQNMSSGGSYYEASGDDEQVLVVPIKSRVNGVLETVQQKLISYEKYQILKEELKDSKDSVEVLKQKVEHLDSLLKLKDERIDELQKQLERKQARRKETEALQNSLSVPFEIVPPPVFNDVIATHVASDATISTNLPNSPSISNIPIKIPSVRLIESSSKIPKREESKICVLKSEKFPSKTSITEISDIQLNSLNKLNNLIPALLQSVEADDTLDRINSDVFKEIEIVDDKLGIPDEEFKDSEQEVITIEDTIQKEIKEIINPMDNVINIHPIN